MKLLLYALLFYGGVRFVLPLLMPFLFALSVAALVQQPAALLASRIPRLNQRHCCVILTAVLLLTVALLLSAAVCSLLDGAMAFCPGIPDRLTKAHDFLAQAAASAGDQSSWGRFVNAVVTGMERGVDFMTENYRQYLPSMLTRSTGWLRKLPSLLTAVLFGTVAALFACGEFDLIKRTVRQYLPAPLAETLAAVIRAAVRTLTALLKTYGVLMAITFGELAAGFTLMRLMGYHTGNILTNALLISLIDILPILGTGTVLVPWGLFEILTGSLPLGLMLLGMFAVIGLLRNFLEPKFMARQLELPPFFTLAGVYIGGKLFGPAGIVLLPLIMLTLRDYRNPVGDAQNAASP